MIAFFVIAAAAGAMTAGSTAGDAGPKLGAFFHSKHAESKTVAAAPPTQAPIFNPGAYSDVSDCLTAAAREHAELGLCSNSQ